MPSDHPVYVVTCVAAARSFLGPSEPMRTKDSGAAAGGLVGGAGLRSGEAWMAEGGACSGSGASGSGASGSEPSRCAAKSDIRGAQEWALGRELMGAQEVGGAGDGNAHIGLLLTHSKDGKAAFIACLLAGENCVM